MNSGPCATRTQPGAATTLRRSSGTSGPHSRLPGASTCACLPAASALMPRIGRRLDADGPAADHSRRGGLTDCPPSRDPDRRHAAQRHRRDRRCRSARLPRRLAGRRARHAVRPKASACRSSRLARAGAPSRTRLVARPRACPSDTLAGGRVRRLARPAAPRPPPPTLATRPGRPRAAPVPRRRLRRPWPPSTWRTRRPPPHRPQQARRAGGPPELVREFGLGRMVAAVDATA